VSTVEWIHISFIFYEHRSYKIAFVSIHCNLSSNSQNSAQHSDVTGSVLGASYVNNGGGQRFDPHGEDDLALMFAPAEHTEGMKRRKERKRREKRERLSASDKPPARATADNNELNTSHAATPKASGSSSSNAPILKLPDDDGFDDGFDFPSNTSNAHRVVTPSRTPRESRQGTPPSARPPKANPNPARKEQQANELPDDDADVWYGKWWMFCFPDLKHVKFP